jgi:hypothetical protein
MKAKKVTKVAPAQLKPFVYYIDGRKVVVWAENESESKLILISKKQNG